MEKRGQFFLIAAIVISMIIVGLGAVYISTRTPTTEETTVYDLSSEIKSESTQVIDNGVFNARDVSSFLNQLIANYSKSNPDMDIVVIYGSPDNICMINYTATETGVVGVSGGTDAPSNLPEAQIISGEGCGLSADSEGTFNLRLANATYIFNLHNGQNFFIVLEQKKENEKIVAVE